jgi:hypothetical protein
MFNNSFVLVKLVTKENGEKKVLENPGADTLMSDWGGAKAGLPFMVILNAKGEKLADSNRMPKLNAKGEKLAEYGNIGCPASPEEVDAFNKILEETAPRISAEQRAKLGAYFLELNKKK